MTWFAHTCWFCGRKSKAVKFIVGDECHQCIDRAACESRRSSDEELKRAGDYLRRRGIIGDQVWP